MDEFNNQVRKLKETIEALTKELENMKSRDDSLLPARNEFETREQEFSVKHVKAGTQVKFATDDTQVKRATDGTQIKSVASAAVQTETQECNNESENEKRKNADLEDMVKKLEESIRELNYQKDSMLSKHARR